MKFVDVDLNEQQYWLIREQRGRQQPDATDAEFARLIFSSEGERLLGITPLEQPALATGGPTGPDAPGSRLRRPGYGTIREDFVLEPVSARALPIRAGEVLRIIQEEDGGQCVDFNAYNLADYKEHFDAGRTRFHSGMFPHVGHCLYTNSPRDRAMFSIVAMPDTCKAEVLGARCNAAMFERIFGFPMHTNCQDTLAEAVREYDLTPDDVHDSFNLWMYTRVDPSGNMTLEPNRARKGDYVDLLALFDALAVPAICGGGDVFLASNFWLKRVRVQVFGASSDSKRCADEWGRVLGGLRNQRRAEDFRVKTIRTERRLTPNRSYTPEFKTCPLKVETLRVELSDQEYTYIGRVRGAGLAPGSSDGDIVRSLIMLHFASSVAARMGDFQFVVPETEP